jgi:methylamine dehydrogenase accessory protein MauD
MSLLTMSVILLWVALIATIVILLALARQVGVLFERIAPMGALTIDHGPRAGQPAPQFLLPTLDGDLVKIGYPAAKSTLIFFLAPTCPICRKLAPIVKSMAHEDRASLQVIFASDGDSAKQIQYRRELMLSEFPYVLSTELGMAFQVAKLPYAVLIDEHGLMASKGLTNSREHLESLLSAKQLGVASIQEFLRERA